MFQISVNSSITSKPHASQASRNAGAGGLWAQRTALKPCPFRRAALIYSASFMLAAPSRPLSWCTQPPRSLMGCPLSKRPLPVSSLTSRKPTETDAASTVSPLERSSAVNWYSVGVSGVQARIFSSAASAETLGAATGSSALYTLFPASSCKVRSSVNFELTASADTGTMTLRHHAFSA